MGKKEIVKVVLDLVITACIVIFLLVAIRDIYVLSSDVIRGTEFGMLIELVRVSNKILIIVCLSVLHKWFLGECRGSKVVELLKNIQTRIDNK